MNGKVSVKSLVWFGLGALLLVLLAQPLWQRSDEGKPRTIAARGDLAADEQATIDIFNQNSPSVVYITTVDQVLNIWTRDVSEIPSGTGTGFVWDESGHIVTNNHVTNLQHLTVLSMVSNIPKTIAANNSSCL